MKPKKLSFRPHARLLTMLGDQLIKNERIALVELIKNAYDADADRVEIRFEHFKKDLTYNAQSCIVIQDDGTGMTADTVQKEWMNPAVPAKHLAKREGREKTPGKQRIIQGEKGIGRFAVLKLGRVITITTRARGASQETVLTWDFSRFDDDFLTESGKPREIFLDQIKINYSRHKPTKLMGANHGTIIEIRNLKGVWNTEIIESLCRDVSNLTDPVSRMTHHEAINRLKIDIIFNGESQTVEMDSVEALKTLIKEKTVLKITGFFDSSKNSFFFQTGIDKIEINLKDAKITGLWLWRQRFDKIRSKVVAQQIPMLFGRRFDDGNFESRDAEFACGNFAFTFYIFDFSRGIDGRYALIQEEKNLLKNHRIYLYRDGVRVYPYGDPDDDWLNIDVTRGVGRAGNFFSNDQVIGWIDITQRDNPNLRDKTNREGLIEIGGAARDFIFLVQVFLSYIKQYPFSRYQQKQQQRSTARFVRDEVVVQSLVDLKEDLSKHGREGQAAAVARIETAYKREKAYLSQRVETAEDLAGVGLSVEMASHDIMLLLDRALQIGGRLAKMAGTAGKEEFRMLADMLVGVLQQVVDGMRDVQILFKSSRRRRKVQKIEPVLDKIHRIYETLLDQRDIRYRKDTTVGSPLVANTTDGVIMQVLINLFDNAAYWLEAVDPSRREIRVTVDGARNELIFSDSGPGIDPEDLPYIFEPFYSGKGQEGRGLGLYIARQLLERHDYRIVPAADHQAVLPGANFVISFVKEDS